MSKIHLLPQNLINQIAAGEVVERPASVIKELVENSLDAGASHIEVRLVKAGRELISITDDGCGMSPEDAHMSLERHATSKIRSFDDLLKVSSMGFRGEALPSIASISYMTLRTRTPQVEIAHQIKIEGGSRTTEESCAGEIGTTITVEHLFYNVPARRKFLKSDATELKNCVEAVKTLALANTHVDFRLLDNKRVILNLPADESPLERLTRLFGEEVTDDLKEVCYPKDHETRVRISGYAAPIGRSFSTRDKIFFFVNRRYVESKVFHRALRDVYGGALGRGHYPALWLFLEIPADSVDVNVHPAKKEVRFRSESDVYQLLYKALSDALLSGTPRPFTVQDPFGPTPFPFNTPVSRTPNGLPTIAHATPLETRTAIPLKEPAHHQSSQRQPQIPAPLAPSQTFMRVAEDSSSRHGWVFLTFLHSDYALFSTPEGLAIASLTNARQRVTYELVESSFGHAHSQALLVPSLIKLDPHLKESFEENQELFSKQGFIVSAFGTDCYRLEAVPDWLSSQNGFQGTPEALFLSELMSLHDGESSADATLRHQNVCNAAAKAASGPITRAEVACNLIDDLLKSKNPLKSPSGKPTFWHIGREELQKRFGGR